MDPSFTQPEQRSHALMACENCRRRKGKCDEQHPRCGYCKRANVPCVYQEMKPTKKDATLQHIVQTLHSLELKVDRALAGGDTSCSLDRQKPKNESPSDTMPHTADAPSQRERDAHNHIFPASTHDVVSSNRERSLSNAEGYLDSFQVPTSQTKETDNILAWPTVQTILEWDLGKQMQWDNPSQGAEKWLTGISAEFPRLAVDRTADILYSEIGVLVLGGNRSIYLNKPYVESLCAIYFQSFHCIYPILDTDQFYSDLLPRVCERSFSEECEESALVLLVLALGLVAQESVTGSPIFDETGRETGVRGGTLERPPGLIFMNEAKRRIGLALTSWNLNNLQCSILFAIYYSQISRNVEFWRMVTIACTICNGLVKTVTQWNTIESDQISRCFWVCCIFEGGLTGELGLELPWITTLESDVPLPLFLSHSRTQTTKPEDQLFIEYHFLAQITLRTLINRARGSTHQARNLFHTVEKDRDQLESITKELSRQLQSWRTHLPLAITWTDQSVEEETSLSNFLVHNQRAATEALDSALKPARFKTILNAALHTRYKYAEYIIWRPYLRRVLHSSQDPSQHEIESCHRAFQACAHWPMTLAPFCFQRRLMPHNYEYTHTFFGILLLMHVCSLNQFLGPVLRSMPAESDPVASITFYLMWIRDMKAVHPVARWCWRMLKVIYRNHEMVKDTS